MIDIHDRTRKGGHEMEFMKTGSIVWSGPEPGSERVTGIDASRCVWQ